MNNPQRPQQSGIALLIVILALLVVTGVVAGMLVYSTSETRIDANYRDQQVALFAAKAGIEEARNRMLATSTNPISLPCVVPGGVAMPNCTANAAFATYITAAGVSPWTPGNTVNNASTFDSEFMCELGQCGSTVLPSTCCISTTSLASYSGPTANPIPYQWVRINLKPNKTVDAATGQTYWVNNAQSPTAQVYYDPVTHSECIWNSTCNTSDNPGPVYELTSYAVAPSGTIRMLQTDVAAYTFNLKFPSSLTMPGPIGSFNPPNSNGYCMDGNDTSQITTSSIPGTTCSFKPPPSVPGGCSTLDTAQRPAVGVSPGDMYGSTTLTNTQYVTNQIPRPGNYLGSNGTSTTPSVGITTLPSNLSSPAQLQQELSAIQQNSNVCLGCSGSGGGSYTFSNLDTAPGSLWGSCGTSCGTTPQITYVNGNLDISGSTTGSGILVVTGNLTYDGNSSWNGIIMVVGNGLTIYQQNGSGNGQFNGAIFVANTDGDPPGTYGPADFTINGGGGNGLYYNSCWINYVQKPTSYLVLSSKEISQ